jgi:enoyl-CoA hydratase/carnithine racemase
MSDWVEIKSWPELILERLPDAGVARIVLNRPEKRNCWNRPMCLAFLESLEIIRADKSLKVVITKGAGVAFSSGLDLTFLREVSNGPLLDWDRPNLTIRIAEAVRNFPRIFIAQIHGYCLGGALGIVNCHDLVIAASDVQLGMPEVMRGSFGQLVTSTLVHAGIPIKKVSYMALIGRNLSGDEADKLGIVSLSVAPDELEARVEEMARDIASRHLATLEHHKIAMQMDRDLTLSQAIQLDQLVGQRLRRAMDPLGDVEGYLKSQKGAPTTEYRRPDADRT